MLKIGSLILTKGDCIGIAVSCLVTIIIFSGFSEKMYKVAECRATVNRYVTAEYSETSVSMDMDGNTYIDTDYWSEAASDTYRITTINGELASNDFDGSSISHKAFYPPMPQWDKSMSSHTDFDSFRKHTDTGLSVLININGESDQFSSPISDNPNCIAKLNGTIIVDTWYGITYDSEF